MLAHAQKLVERVSDYSETHLVIYRRSVIKWEHKSPILVLRARGASLHFPQTKEIKAKKVKDSKLDPDLVTIAIDQNVKNLAVITVRQHGNILEAVFLTDHGLDQHRYRHLKRSG